MTKKGITASALALSLVFSCFQAAGAQKAYAADNPEQVTNLLADENLSSGVRYTEEDVVNCLGNEKLRLRVNHLTINPNDPNTRITSKKAADSVYSRESVLTQAQEETAKGKNVIAAVNGDSFDINSLCGVSRSINVYNGCVLQSQPYDNYNKCDPTSDTYYKYQSVLYVDTNSKLHAGPLQSNAHVTAGSLDADVTLLNRIDFSYAVQNDCYRAFTACATEDHMLRYVNSSNKTTSAFPLPKTVRYAIVEIDPVNGKSFDGYVKAGQTYTGKVKEIKKTDNLKFSDDPSNMGTKDEFAIPENCLVVAGYTPLLTTDAGYDATKAAQIDKLAVGQSVSYTCNLYTGYGFNTNNNSGPLTGTASEDLLTNVESAIGDFNTLALGGVANTKNSNEVFKRSPSNTARTMVGIEADGTIHLLAINSPSASIKDTTGITYEDVTTYMMQSLHCRDVLSMDGGGSTTMVARRAGENGLSVVNYPSDGSLRLVGNSIMVLNTSTAPQGNVAQVVLGTNIHTYVNSPYQFNVKLTDANGNSISTSGKTIQFTAKYGKIDANGLYTAPAAACSDSVTATVDGVSAGVTVDVADTFAEARVSPDRIPLDNGDVRQFELTAYNAQKQRVYIAPSLVTWKLSNPAMGTMKDGLLTVTADSGETDVTAEFAGKTYATHIYIGLTKQTIEDFETTPVSAYHVSGAMYGVCGSQRGGQDNGGALDKYIGYITKGKNADLVKSGNNSLRITGLTENWNSRTKNGTINIFPDWDAAHPELTSLPWTEEQRAVLEDHFTAKVLPKKFGLWVYSPDDDKDGVSDNKDCQLVANFLQNCPGSKVAGYDSQSSYLTLASSVDWIGWKWVEVNIPQTWDMPVVFNWMYMVNINKAAATGLKNEIIVDDLTFIYGDEKSPAEAPQASLAGGAYTGTQTVTLTCATEGAVIRYTTDGSEPTASSGTVYTAPIQVNGSVTVKAKAFKSGMKPSATMTEAYAITPTYAVTVNGGSGSGQYAAGSVVSISAQVPSGKVFDKWTGDGVTFADAASAATTFVMPARAASVTASFCDAPRQQVTQEDKATGVKLTYDEGTVPPGAVLFVEKVSDDSVEHAFIADVVISIGKKFTAYNIKLLVDKIARQPDGNLLISLPIPEGFDTSRLAIVYVGVSGKAEEIPIEEIKDNRVTFKTNHLSSYVLVEKKSAPDSSSQAGPSSSQTDTGASSAADSGIPTTATGEAMPGAAYALFILFALAGAVLLVVSRKKEHN